MAAMFDGRDTTVIFEKLAYEDLLPVRWRPQPAQPTTSGPALRGAQPARAAGLRCARRARPAREEETRRRVAALGGSHAARFQAQSVAGSRRPVAAQSQSRMERALVRFNAMGATWKTGETLTGGSHGILEVTLRDIDRAAAEPSGAKSSPARTRETRACGFSRSAKPSPITSRSSCFAATGEKLPARASSRRASTKPLRKFH